MLLSIGAPFLGIFLLQVFFRVAESKWPQSYYSIADLLSYRISSSPVKYTLFRFGPVFTVAFFLAASFARAEESASLPLMLLLGGHILLTSGRGFINLVQAKPTFAFEIRLLAHLVVTVGIVGFGALGGFLGSIDQLHAVVPTTREIPQSLWTAGLAAVVGVFLLETTKGSSLEASQLLESSRRSIPDQLWEEARHLAEKHGTDPYVAQAILAAENLQRPSWFRKAERIKGIFLKHGSYGIMQVHTDRPISDLESIQLAIQERLANVRVPETSYGADLDRLRDALTAYNPDRRFVEMAEAFYQELNPPSDDDIDGGASRVLKFFDPEEVVYMAVPAVTGFALGLTTARIVRTLRKLHFSKSN